MLLRCKLHGQTFEFRDLREVMGKASQEKSGDRLAGVAAASALERAADCYALSDVPLWALRENPAVPYDEDEVTRVIDDAVDPVVYAEIRGWTASELREWLLNDSTHPAEIRRASTGMTADVIAAVAKLMSNLDLCLASARMRVVTRANTTLGLPGTLAARLQPNHPTDDGDAIRAESMEGHAPGRTAGADVPIHRRHPARQRVIRNIGGSAGRSRRARQSREQRGRAKCHVFRDGRGKRTPGRRRPRSHLQICPDRAAPARSRGTNRRSHLRNPAGGGEWSEAAGC